MFILKAGLWVLSPLSALTILPSIRRGASKQRGIAERWGSDLSCHMTDPHAAGFGLRHYTFSTLMLSRSPATPPASQWNPHQTRSQCTGATALLANLRPGNPDGERGDQAPLQGMWPSSALLLYPLITIVLQSNFMYL